VNLERNVMSKNSAGFICAASRASMHRHGYAKKCLVGKCL
jgi:hypothetical protein